MAATGRLMLIEDHDDVRQVFAFMLRKLNYDVVECQTGEEAIQSFAAEKPIAAIIDLNLPDMPGLEVVKKFRQLEQQNPRLESLPKPVVTVALTGHASDAQRENAIAAGFDLYFVKPVEMETVSAAIQSLSSHRVH